MKTLFIILGIIGITFSTYVIYNDMREKNFWDIVVLILMAVNTVLNIANL